MVKLEWQNALFKSTKGKLKFIPVKIDDCIMPSLLFQNLHIDLYNYGFEVGISQIFNVINGTNTFVRTSGEFSNVIASLKYISSSKIEVEICAIHFHEPISHYLTIFKNNPETITLKVKTDGFFTSGQGKDIRLSDGHTYNWHAFSVSRATAPVFPVSIEIETTDNAKIEFCGILKEVAENKFKMINTVVKS